MAAETLIYYYNRLNGKSITLKTLKEFHQRLQKQIDSDSHGSFAKDIKGIYERVTKAIKKMVAAGADIAEKVELIPIDIQKSTGKVLRVASGYEPSESSKPGNSAGSKTVFEIPMSSIYTDTKRFQNRVDHFSEASANNVALHFDPNKFDPIVVWKDATGKIFVLSGHSRFEGMKRRKATTIPVRYFEGNEEEAIKFARVEANRSANQESLVEDLAAYKLMRDGDQDKDIRPATKTELQRIFKGKVGKLEAYSYLNTGGLFLQALSQSNTSNYPYLERNAQWIGIIRNLYPVISHTGEDNMFHFFYSDKSGRNIKISKDDFFGLVKKKVNGLRKDESVLFPECSADGCKATVDREADPQKGEAFKRLREINEALESIREKLTSKDASVRVTTDEEKKYLRATAEKLEEEKQRINRDLDLMDKSQASLFGYDIQPVKNLYSVGVYEGKLKYGKNNQIAADIYQAKIEGSEKALQKIKEAMYHKMLFGGLPYYEVVIPVKPTKSEYNIAGEVAKYLFYKSNGSLRYADKPIKAAVNGRNILLVDDVVYSGTTIRKYIDKLKKLGAHNITVLVYGKSAEQDNSLRGMQYEAFPDVKVVKPTPKGKLNRLQMAQLQDAIKAGATPKVNLNARLNAKQKEAPLFDMPVNDPAQARLFGIKKKPLEIVTANSIATMKFNALPFEGKWKKHIGSPSENFSAMIWGKPKQGKSYYAFQFANYLSQFGCVLYVLSDEGIQMTVQEKIKATGLANNKSVHFLETRQIADVTKALATGTYKYVVTDLINNIRNGEDKLEAREYYSIRKQFPKVGFIAVFSSTKTGNFKGENEWAHDVDVLIDVAAGIATAQGRFGGGEYEIFKKKAA